MGIAANLSGERVKPSHRRTRAVGGGPLLMPSARSTCVSAAGPTPSRDLQRLTRSPGSPGERRRAAPSFQKRPGLIQICRIELGEIHQPAVVVKRHVAVPKRHQPAFAKLPQDAVHMDRA